MTDITKIKISWDDIQQDCHALAKAMVTAHLVTDDTKGFVALARGGLSIAQMLGHFLRIRRIECITVMARADDMKNLGASIIGTPSVDIGDGSGWIVVDDLVDTGRSYRFIKAMLPHARFVALYAKTDGQKDAEITLKTFPQDTWLDFPWEVESIN